MASAFVLSSQDTGYRVLGSSGGQHVVKTWFTKWANATEGLIRADLVKISLEGETPRCVDVIGRIVKFYSVQISTSGNRTVTEIGRLDSGTPFSESDVCPLELSTLNEFGVSPMATTAKHVEEQEALANLKAIPFPPLQGIVPDELPDFEANLHAPESDICPRCNFDRDQNLPEDCEECVGCGTFSATQVEEQEVPADVVTTTFPPVHGDIPDEPLEVEAVQQAPESDILLSRTFYDRPTSCIHCQRAITSTSPCEECLDCLFTLCQECASLHHHHH